MQKAKYSAVVLHRILTRVKKSFYATAFLSSPGKLHHIVAYFSNFFFPSRMQVCVRLYFFSLPVLDRDEEKG